MKAVAILLKAWYNAQRGGVVVRRPITIWFSSQVLTIIPPNSTRFSGRKK